MTVAVLLLVPRRFWSAVLAGNYLSELASHVVLAERPATAVGVAFSDTVGPLVGAPLVRRWGRPWSRWD